MSNPYEKIIPVVGAVVQRNGAILCAQRGSGTLAGLWEFPGGKIEANETPREALIREIIEELNCQIEVGDEVTTTSHLYTFGTVVLTTFYCKLIEGEPSLTQHSEVRWLNPRDLEDLEWAPADVPAVKIIKAHLA